jgi:hypothetical protein
VMGTKNGLTVSIHGVPIVSMESFFNLADSLCERMDIKEFDPYGRLEICGSNLHSQCYKSIRHQRGLSNRIKIEQNYIML